ncbi:MAG: HlyD family efflux transporter periplasmic adaptor subunit [Eubacteriales bacterium]
MEVNAAIIRDEKVIMSEPYEKITFDVVEGETVNNDQVIAQLYKRGYQDETMVTLLNLQKQIYDYQMQLLGGQQPQELIDLNNSIDEVEKQDSALCPAGRARWICSILSKRSRIWITSALHADADHRHAGYHIDPALHRSQNAAKRDERLETDIKNTSGTGIVSFYFDGYEQVLSVNKLSTINSALVKTVVNGGNTAKNADSTSEVPLYRIINNTHWFIAFVTSSNDPMRLAEGEQYSVLFQNYSDQQFTATARASRVSKTRWSIYWSSTPTSASSSAPAQRRRRSVSPRRVSWCRSRQLRS